MPVSHATPDARDLLADSHRRLGHNPRSSARRCAAHCGPKPNPNGQSPSRVGNRMPTTRLGRRGRPEVRSPSPSSNPTTSLTCSRSDLTSALIASRQQVEQGQRDALPPYREPAFPVPEEERIKVLDVMVLTCYPEEMKRTLHKQKLEKLDRDEEKREARKAEDLRREEQSRRLMD
jgi:hypothetical protein